MKLTNPTDDQLNAAFAEHVAGWKYRSAQYDSHYLEISPGGWYSADGAFCGAANFTTRSDAVLPWLEKWRDGNPIYRVIRMNLANNCNTHWQVELDDNDLEEDHHEAWFMGSDKSITRAAVIALLRAHGVEVEFLGKG